MNHTGITGNCASCHETGKTWYGVTMVDRPTARRIANHPTTGDCSNCHASTTSFTSGVAKPSNHIPTSQACTLCHTNATNYAVYTMSHSGITNNCAQCHAAGLTFANIMPKEPPANALADQRFGLRELSLAHGVHGIRSGHGHEAHRDHRQLRELP